MRYLLITLLLIPLNCFAFGLGGPLDSVIEQPAAPPSGDECANFIYCYNAETGESTTEISTTGTGVNLGYSTTALRGAKAIRTDMTGALSDFTVTIDAEETVMFHMLFRESVISTSIVSLVEFYSGSTKVGNLSYTGGATDSFSITVGSLVSSFVYYDFAPDTTYHMYLLMNAATKTMYFYIAEAGTFTVPAALVSKVGNNTANTIDKIKFVGVGYSSGLYRFYDQLLIKGSYFGSVPE